MADSVESGHLEFKKEGFRVYWDASGLRIEATDYHPDILRLSWDTIADLAKRAKVVADPARVPRPMAGVGPAYGPRRAGRRRPARWRRCDVRAAASPPSPLTP
jgi:hypothetical protein